MNYKFSSLKPILDVLEVQEKLWASEIADIVWKSRTIVHKYLNELVKRWEITKIGTPPYVKYQKKNIKKNQNIKKNMDDILINYEDKKILDEAFYKISSTWQIQKWFEWFKKWCEKRNFDFKTKKNSFINIYKHIQKLQDNCWNIPAKRDFWKKFDKIYLNNVYYSDQYTRMDFWRWKLAEMAFYAKSSQNKKLIDETLDEIMYKIKCIIKSNNYDAIAIVPWSIDRKNQLLKILKDKLKVLDLPFVNIIKYYSSWIIVAQKSLKTRQERIENAQNTIFVDDIKTYDKVFLIDDFVGSGSTLNETAKKLKENWTKKVDWYAFVWNLDLSYEVINEI